MMFLKQKQAAASLSYKNENHKNPFKVYLVSPCQNKPHHWLKIAEYESYDQALNCAEKLMLRLRNKDSKNEIHILKCSYERGLTRRKLAQFFQEGNQENLAYARRIKRFA